MIFNVKISWKLFHSKQRLQFFNKVLNFFFFEFEPCPKLFPLMQILYFKIKLFDNSTLQNQAEIF